MNRQQTAVFIKGCPKLIKAFLDRSVYGVSLQKLPKSEILPYLSLG